MSIPQREEGIGALLDILSPAPCSDLDLDIDPGLQGRGVPPDIHPPARPRYRPHPLGRWRPPHPSCLRNLLQGIQHPWWEGRARPSHQRPEGLEGQPQPPQQQRRGQQRWA